MGSIGILRHLRSAKRIHLRYSHTLNNCRLSEGPISSNLIDHGEDIDKKNVPNAINTQDFVYWCVKEEENGARLDRFIKRHAPGLPPGLIQKLIRKGRITVDGASPRRNAYPLEPNSIVGVPGDIKLGLTRGKRAPPPDDTTLAEAFEIRKWILHRDARCVVLNKPPGISTQGGRRSEERHIEAMLSGIGSGRYWLVHRLDREVSGTLVVARDVGAAALLGEYFRERKISKTYWALVKGKPITPSGVITAPIAGKTAFTKYSTIASEESGNCTLLELKPTTGRKHQLRIHCAGVLGTPIVGDLRYSPKTGLKSLVPRESEWKGINLHARRIEFPALTKVHLGGAKPQLGVKAESFVDVEAPLPQEMREYWESLGILHKTKSSI